MDKTIERKKSLLDTIILTPLKQKGKYQYCIILFSSIFFFLVLLYYLFYGFKNHPSTYQYTQVKYVGVASF